MVQKRPPTRPPVHHFGERLRVSPLGFRLVREEYALPSRTNTTWEPRELRGDALWAAHAWIYEDEDHRRYSDEYCERQRAAALENFDLNMAFFRHLSGKDFLEALNTFVGSYSRLQPVTELASLDGVEGVYVMVLDRYKQVYIGEASDMRKRIKRHWAGTKQFDRLIFPDKETSVLSIDSFRALGTTRIFAEKTRRGWTWKRTWSMPSRLTTCSTVSMAVSAKLAAGSCSPRSSNGSFLRPAGPLTRPPAG